MANYTQIITVGVNDSECFGSVFDSNKDHLNFFDFVNDDCYTSLLFTNVTIDQGSVLTAAALHLIVHVPFISLDFQLKVSIQDIDNAIAPTNCSELIVGNNSPDHFLWDIPTTSESNPDGTNADEVFFDGPELTQLLYSVTNRPGWVSGNSLRLVITKSRGGAVHTYTSGIISLFRSSEYFGGNSGPALSIDWVAPYPTNYELGPVRLPLQYYTPHFAPVVEFIFGPYALGVPTFGAHAGMSHEFVLPEYSIVPGYRLPQLGTGFFLGPYPITPQMGDWTLTYGTLFTVGSYCLGNFTTGISNTFGSLFTLPAYRINPLAIQPFHVFVNPGKAKCYIEAVANDSQTIYGVSIGEAFKLDHAVLVHETDVQEIHLAKVKPAIGSGNFTFMLLTPTPILAGQFFYQTQDHLLTIANETDWLNVLTVDTNSLVSLHGEVVDITDDEGVQMVTSGVLVSPGFSWGKFNGLS